MASVPVASIYTFEEYLALERTLEERHEYHDGVMVCMSGGKEPHARLGARMTSLLDRLFPDCRVYGDNLRVRIEAVNRSFYPDAQMLCGEPAFWNDQTDVIVNPRVIVEVLSPSTAKFDRGEKLGYWQLLPSVTDILLISQDSPYVEHSRKEGGVWMPATSHTVTSEIALLSVSLAVSAIYKGIL